MSLYKYALVLMQVIDYYLFYYSEEISLSTLQNWKRT